jgi:hypothetical protein
VEFPLYLRIPGWCEEAGIAVNGTPVAARADDKGFVRIARVWARNDEVTIALPMQPRVARGYETEFPSANREYFSFEPPQVFEPRRLPYASVLYGPLLFSFPIPDVDSNTPVKNARWQYAIDTDARKRDGGIEVVRHRMPHHWDWSLDAPVELEAPARIFDWRPTDAQALPDRPVAGAPAETIHLVPYGCTKFRISMFPVTVGAWGSDAH